MSLTPPPLRSGSPLPATAPTTAGMGIEFHPVRVRHGWGASKKPGVMPPTLRRFTPAIAASFATVLFACPARAQGDKAGAEALLSDAVKLTAAHHYAEACPKLEESLRLYSSLNTEYFLADCYEHVGKTATAWADFLEVAEKARAVGEMSKEKRARERARIIEAQVSHLTIQVTSAGASGLKIERDGVEVGRGQWGVAMPVDAGEHVIVASSPGHLGAKLRVAVKGDGDNASVVVPELAAEPTHPQPMAAGAPPPASAVPATMGSASLSAAAGESKDASHSTGNGQRTTGWIVGGAGILGMGMGGVLALVAKSSYESAPLCMGTVCQDTNGLGQRNSARDMGNVATAVVLGAGAVTGLGLIVWLTAPNSQHVGVERTRLGVTARGVVLDGRF